MATGFTNFSEYTTGTIPSDWAEIWVATNETWAVREKTGALVQNTLNTNPTNN